MCMFIEQLYVLLIILSNGAGHRNEWEWKDSGHAGVHSTLDEKKKRKRIETDTYADEQIRPGSSRRLMFIVCMRIDMISSLLAPRTVSRLTIESVAPTQRPIYLQSNVVFPPPSAQMIDSSNKTEIRQEANGERERENVYLLVLSCYSNL